jgi:hypothetical protein
MDIFNDEEDALSLEELMQASVAKDIKSEGYFRSDAY